MSWTRGLLAVLAVCVLLVTGSVSCGTSGAQDHKDGQSVSPVGKVLGNTDHEGRHYREVDQGSAPDVGIEVQPGTDDCWSVRLDVENFVFSPTGTTSRAVSGHGVAVLFVDGHPVTTLRTPAYRLDAGYVPQGTHKVTARLYADDGTVWAVDGDPIESTADVTASEPRSTANTATAGTDGGSESQSMTGAGGDGTQSQLTTSAGAGGSEPQLRTAAGVGGTQLDSMTGAGGRASQSRSMTSTGSGASEVQAAASTGGGR